MEAKERGILRASEVFMKELIQRQVTQGPDVLLQELDEDAVLLNLRNGQYYGMDGNSYHMYKALIRYSSVSEAYDVLLHEYKVEPEQLRRDLNNVVSNLLENGLLVYADHDSQ
jgi:hypothetical protein